MVFRTVSRPINRVDDASDVLESMTFVAAVFISLTQVYGDIPNILGIKTVNVRYLYCRRWFC